MPLSNLRLNVHGDGQVHEAHHFHMDAGELASWAYTLISGLLVPLMATSSWTPSDKKTALLMWAFMAIVYFWLKGKRITTIIDKKVVLSSSTAKSEQIILFLPFLATVSDLLIMVGTRIHYGIAEWIVLLATPAVTAMVLHTNYSFINDLLKAAPIAERLEKAS